MKTNLQKFLFRVIFISTIICMVSCKNEDKNKLAFIGDSIVAGWDVEYYFPASDIVNYSLYGAKVSDIKKMSAEFLPTNTSIVLVGTNDLNMVITDTDLLGAITKLVNIYSETIHALKTDRVIVVSILPRYESNFTKSNRINQQIDVMNAQLEIAFRNHPTIKFLDVNGFFKNKEGQLDMNYSADGVHLNVYGYQLLSSKLSALL